MEVRVDPKLFTSVLDSWIILLVGLLYECSLHNPQPTKSVVEIWKFYSKTVLFPILRQINDVCWAIALIRHLNALLIIHGGLADHIVLSIQRLLDIIPRILCTENGAIRHPTNAFPYLSWEGTVTEGVCQLTYELFRQAQVFFPVIRKYTAPPVTAFQLSEFGSNEFESIISTALKYSPLSIAVPNFPSYSNFNGRGIYVPTLEELQGLRERVRNNQGIFHCMVLCGEGEDEHGNGFWETQESKGSHWGEFGGFARFAKGHSFITHAFVMECLTSLPVAYEDIVEFMYEESTDPLYDEMEIGSVCNL